MLALDSTDSPITRARRRRHTHTDRQRPVDSATHSVGVRLPCALQDRPLIWRSADQTSHVASHSDGRDHPRRRVQQTSHISSTALLLFVHRCRRRCTRSVKPVFESNHEKNSYYYYYYYYYAAFNAPCVGHKDDESQARVFATRPTCLPLLNCIRK